MMFFRCEERLRTEQPQGRPVDAQGRAKWPKVGPRSPKWSQNGGPGLPRNCTRTQSP